MKTQILKSLVIAIISIQFIVIADCKAQNENWIPFGFQVKNNNYDGLQFRFEAAVRAEIEDDSACAYLWFRVDKTDKTMGFFDNMAGKPIRTKEWKIYTIEGVIDTNAQHLVFGGFCEYNGTFCFDKMKLSIKNNEDNWETIRESGFEKGFDGWINDSLNQYFSHELVSDNSFEGNKHFRIIGKNVPIFEINKNHGK